VSVSPGNGRTQQQWQNWRVSTSGISTYGDPCRECGFSWGASLDSAVALMSAVPSRVGALLAGATGRERLPVLEWSVGAYVSHIGDNLTIWTERLRGVASGAPPLVGAYDESALARARNYEEIALPAALWSLGRAVVEWGEAVAQSDQSGTVLIHPERGKLTLRAVVLANVHDALHHAWDIERTLRCSATERAARA
jgi:hypothetical protein